MARPEKIRLGDLLVTQKLISMEQLAFALDQQKRTGRKLGRVLVDTALSPRSRFPRRWPSSSISRLST